MGFGERGERGLTGERGKTGDHGQMGDTGEVGATGKTGATGQRGPGYSSWITRHILQAYVLLWIGVMLSFILTAFLYSRALEEISLKARRQCEAGNTRSLLQRDDYRESAQRTQQLDLERLLGIDTATAAEIRRISLESADRRMANLPYFDCITGKRVPPPKG